jgi:biotin synthase
VERKDGILLAERILRGETLHREEYQALAGIPEGEVLNILPGADLLREYFFGKTVHLCAIGNGKAGRCSEDCRFCAQSAHFKTDATVYPLQEEDALAAPGLRMAQTPVNRYSIVTTGKGLPDDEVARVALALSTIRAAGIHTCASLGILGEEELTLLKAAGFPGIITIWRPPKVFFRKSAPPMALMNGWRPSGRPRKSAFPCAPGVFSGSGRRTSRFWSWL